MATGSKKPDQLEEVSTLQAEDQFIFFQNSSKKQKEFRAKILLEALGLGHRYPE